jgi:hypothetical protein
VQILRPRGLGIRPFSARRLGATINWGNLRVDAKGLTWCHMPEPATPVEDTIKASKTEQVQGGREPDGYETGMLAANPATAPPRLAPAQLVAMQRLVGNRAVADLIHPGGPLESRVVRSVQPQNVDARARTPDGRSSGPRGHAPGPAYGLVPVQRAAAVSDAIAANTVEAISKLSGGDIANASVDDRLKMVDIVLAGGGGEVLPRLWDSFGAGLQAAATAHSAQWEQSMKQHAGDMRNSREVTTLQAAFKDDITTVAQGYLTDNDGVVKAEMARLGIPEQGEGGGPTTAAQDDAVRKTQADAQKLSEVQQHREELSKTEIAFHRRVVEKGGSELPAGGADNVENKYDPVYFDPDNAFDAASQPTDYIAGLRTWDDTKKQHVALSNVISAYLSTNPALYALVGSDQSGQSAGGVTKVSPEQARKTLGDQLRTVRDNIAKTRPMVPTLALQMTPVQEQMLSNSIGANVHLGRDWSLPFFHVLADDVTAQQQPGPWWQQLGLMSLEMAAYVVAGLATGGVGPLLLAGGQAAISVGKYQALEAASHANVTPDTVLIKDGEVLAAAVEATIAVVMAFLAALGAARAAFASRIASPAFDALAKDLGEDVARQLLLELSPDAANALKDKLGNELLKDLVGANVGGASIEKLAQELTADEIQALLKRVPTGLGTLLERAGSASVLNSLLDKCPDLQQLGRLMDQVDRPETLAKYLERFAPDELEQRISATAAAGVPQGLTAEEFSAMSQQLRAAAGKYGNDIRVHGSRASGAGLGDADLDIAIRVEEERFNQILKDRFKAPNPGSQKESTMQWAIKTGKIQRGELGLSGVGKEVGRDLAIKKIDISVVKIGGATDNGPWIPLK